MDGGSCLVTTSSQTMEIEVFIHAVQWLMFLSSTKIAHAIVLTVSGNVCQRQACTHARPLATGTSMGLIVILSIALMES